MPDRDNNGRDDRDDLRALAERALRAREFLTATPPDARAELDALREPTRAELVARARDLTALPWTSIDNDDSRDLDQLEVADELPGGVRVRVAIAEVDHVAPLGSALDRAAAHNGTTVYTAGGVFPMLPRKLSEGFTSLLPGEDRLAIVTELDVADDGRVLRAEHYPAVVRNHAKLTYDSVSPWLEGAGPAPEQLAQRPELAAQVKLHDRAAQNLRRARFARGALGIDNAEPREVRDAAGRVIDVVARHQTRAGALVEDLMIAVNESVARFLEARGLPSLRRVVRSPERWPRLVEVAASWGGALPATPSAPALAAFLRDARARHPDRFEEISVAVVKLVGRGVYAAKAPGAPPPGHFGLAASDYAHSTAPNRRYPDVVTRRLLAAACAGRASPYTLEQLDAAGARCSEREHAAQKVSRQVQKHAAALLLSGREGQLFDGVITGASDKGTWVRIHRPAVEGRLVRGERGLDVGERVRVRLEGCDVGRGFLDFVRA